MRERILDDKQMLSEPLAEGHKKLSDLYHNVSMIAQ